jgi:hypothetical protein
LLFYDTSGFILEGHNMLGEKGSIKDIKPTQDTNTIKGNEAEEFITKIVLNVLFTGVVILVGVGIAFYYISDAF